MNREHLYIQSFLASADPLRFGQERFSFPREKRIYRVNTEEQISWGFKLRKYQNIRLPRFTDSGWSSKRRERTGTAYNAFRCSINRKDSDRAKKWFFLTYPDDALVSFIVFDIDRHYSPEMTDLEKLAQHDKAQVTVDAILDMALDTNSKVLWTTSPGNFYDDAHIQGLYGYIKLAVPMKHSELKAKVKALKETYGIECESNDTLSMFRSPGQRFVEVCNPRTYQILDPLEEGDKPSKTLAVFMDAWEGLPATDTDDLFHPEIVVLNKPAVSVVKRTRKSLINAITEDEAVEMHSTFWAATQYKLVSKSVHRHKRLGSTFDACLSEVVQGLPKIRPTDSATCSNESLLYRTCKGWTKWYWDGYVASKCGSRQDEMDRERINESIQIEDRWLLEALKKRGLSSDELKGWKRFRELEKKWNGRVGYEHLYACFGGQRQYFRVKRKLHDALAIYVEYDKSNRKCRQWGSHKTLLQEAYACKAAAKWYLNYGKELEQKIRSASPAISKEDILKEVAKHYIQECSNQAQNHAAGSLIPLHYEQISRLGIPETFDWDKLLMQTAA